MEAMRRDHVVEDIRQTYETGPKKARNEGYDIHNYFAVASSGGYETWACTEGDVKQACIGG